MKFYCLLLLLILTACSDETTAPQTTPATQNISLNRMSGNPNYWTINGEPAILIGGSNYEYPYLADDWQEELDYLKKTGGNYVRFALPIFDKDSLLAFNWLEDTGNDNQTYADSWNKLAAYLNYAFSIGMIVEIDVWDHDNITTKSWATALQNNGGTEHKYWSDEPFLAGEHPFLNTVPNSLAYPKSYADLLERQQAFVVQLLNHSQAYSNLIYNVSVPSNAYIPWMVFWGKFIEQQATQNNTTANVNLGVGKRLPVSMAGFSRDLLQGKGEAFHRPPPKGNGLNGLALSSIRGVRIVERHLKFWELQPASDILEKGSAATAATDNNGNYLIHIPTAGSVQLTPDWEEQRPVRVTVVGYLGTQKSEVLQPPYGDTFTLFTEEEKGGWMILKPE